MSESEIRFHTLPDADEITSIEDLSEIDYQILSIYDEINGRSRNEPDLKRAHKLLDDFKDQSCIIASPEDEPDEVATVANVDFYRGKQQAWIDGIATHPDYRGQKFGSEMIKFIEQESKVRALAAVALNSIPTAIQFYTKIGFDLNQTQPASSKDGRVMIKPLDTLT
jgi:GNAT superfamily N-acetyltransferase